jgi:hypothetical protein
LRRIADFQSEYTSGRSVRPSNTHHRRIPRRIGKGSKIRSRALGEVDLIPSIEVTRLARDCSDWYPLLDVCGHRRRCAKQHLPSRRIETEFGEKYLITRASVEKHTGVGRSFVGAEVFVGVLRRA